SLLAPVCFVSSVSPHRPPSPLITHTHTPLTAPHTHTHTHSHTHPHPHSHTTHTPPHTHTHNTTHNPFHLGSQKVLEQQLFPTKGLCVKNKRPEGQKYKTHLI